MGELSTIIIINEVRCADTSFHSICRQWRHYNFRNMIAISCFPRAKENISLELCWIAFETLQTETGKKLKRNCNCSIQFSFLKTVTKIALRTLYAIVCWEIIKFSFYHTRKKKRVTNAHWCVWSFLLLPLSTAFRTKCFLINSVANIHKRNKLKKISGIFLLAGFSVLRKHF